MRIRVNFIATLFAVLWALSVLPISRSIYAAEWSAQPAVRLGENYNDNFRMTIAPHNSVKSSLFAPKLDLGASSDRWKVSSRAEAVQNRFSGDSDLDSDDRLYNLAALYKTERSTWQLSGAISRSSLLSDQQVSPETGVVQVQRVEDLHSISPSWTWAMTELTQLQLVYSLINVSYVNGVSTGLHDYSTREASATLTNTLDPNTQVFFSAGYSIFNIPENAVSQVDVATFVNTLVAKSATYQAGIMRVFSATTRGNLSVGVRKTSSEQEGLQLVGSQFCLTQPPNFQCPVFDKVTFHSKLLGTVFSGSFDKQFENNRFTVTVSRSLNASGTGGQVQTDSLRLALNRSFTSNLSGGLTYSSDTYSEETGNVSGIGSRFHSIEPALEWRWTPEWVLNTNYRYTRLRRVVEDRPVSSNAVNLTLSYQWPKMALSR